MFRTPAPDSLASLLQAHTISWETLHHRYGPLMELVRTLIGVVPNCDRYLEIWPPAFRTYNLVVPNLMNLPAAIFGLGGAPKSLVGLSMLVASRTAECPYCTAHTCSFALRRGAAPEVVAAALLGREGLTPQEAAVVAAASALSRIPCDFTHEQRTALEHFFSPAQAEWIAMGAVAMGFLNKFMDAVGVELEASTVAEVQDTLGPQWNAGAAGWDLDARGATPPPPADGWRAKLRILPFLPTALRLDALWQRGVPASWPATGAYLREHTGHDFPVLGRLHNARCRKAIAAVLRINLDPAHSSFERETKLLAGVIFATVIQDDALAHDLAALARAQGTGEERLAEARAFASDAGAPAPAGDARAQALLVLAKAAAPSPACVTLDTVEICRRATLAPQSIIEMVSWLSVLQLLHRLTAYVLARG